MGTGDTQRRTRAASAATGVIEGTVSFKRFVLDFGDSDDPLIDEVVDLLTHEPQRGGLLGVKENDWAEYRRKTLAAIDALEQIN